MFKIKKTLEVAASHSIYFKATDSHEPLHGHNFKITIYCQSETLNEDGFVVDFCEIERRIHDYLDHQDLNDILPFNPTTELLAKWVCDNTPNCYQVDVLECEGNEATYIK